tara:strand:+ start:2705 stop:3358 length:654 start_codon:yes stop_codon:yes gene_type:complete
MALSEAEKRRRRFLKEKNKFSNFNQLVKHHKEKDQTVWFDNEGNILQISADYKRKKTVKEKSAVFTKEQLGILEGKDVNLYRVVQDAEIETVFTIDLKPLESPFVENDKEFLQLIPKSKSKVYDVKITLKKDKFTVKLHNKIIKKYKDIEPGLAVANGKKVLKFYLTSKNDPHFMDTTLNFNLSDLLKQKEITKKLSKNLDQCSIYTIKLFDKYVCI